MYFQTLDPQTSLSIGGYLHVLNCSHLLKRLLLSLHIVSWSKHICVRIQNWTAQTSRVRKGAKHSDMMTSKRWCGHHEKTQLIIRVFGKGATRLQWGTNVIRPVEWWRHPSLLVYDFVYWICSPNSKHFDTCLSLFYCSHWSAPWTVAGRPAEKETQKRPILLPCPLY